MKYMWYINAIKNGEGMKKKRFTLIEMLVCIAIISILVAMLLPGLSLVRFSIRKARIFKTESTFKYNDKQIETGIKKYPKKDDEDELVWLKRVRKEIDAARGKFVEDKKIEVKKHTKVVINATELKVDGPLKAFEISLTYKSSSDNEVNKTLSVAAQTPFQVRYLFGESKYRSLYKIIKVTEVIKPRIMGGK